MKRQASKAGVKQRNPISWFTHSLGRGCGEYCQLCRSLFAFYAIKVAQTVSACLQHENLNGGCEQANIEGKMKIKLVID